MKERCSTHQVLVFLSFSPLAWNVLQTLYGPDRHGQARKEVCKEAQTHQIRILMKIIIAKDPNVDLGSDLVKRFYRPSFYRNPLCRSSSLWIS